MDTSIQEKLQKINSSIQIGDILALFLLLIPLAGLLLYQSFENGDSKDIVYRESATVPQVRSGTDTRPFGSVHGTTYTFSWCKGSQNILTKNRIYFANDEDARNHGRTISKMCN
jgi:hypothetical protein